MEKEEREAAEDEVVDFVEGMLSAVLSEMVVIRCGIVVVLRVGIVVVGTVAMIGSLCDLCLNCLMMFSCQDEGREGHLYTSNVLPCRTSSTLSVFHCKNARIANRHHRAYLSWIGNRYHDHTCGFSGSRENCSRAP